MKTVKINSLINCEVAICDLIKNKKIARKYLSDLRKKTENCSKRLRNEFNQYQGGWYEWALYKVEHLMCNRIVGRGWLIKVMDYGCASKD